MYSYMIAICISADALIEKRSLNFRFTINNTQPRLLYVISLWSLRPNFKKKRVDNTKIYEKKEKTPKLIKT